MNKHPKSERFVIPHHWTDRQIALLERLDRQRAVFCYWCSDAWGFPSNGGTCTVRARPALEQTEPGPMSLCERGTLHATREPHRWQGVRVWVVALLGDVVEQDHKLGALKRVFVGEFLPGDQCPPSCRAAMRADLRGANLGGANLRGADLGGADLRGANLGGANLERADLGGADLGGAYLGGANLELANFGGAYLGGANLELADLGGAYLGGAYLGGADLRGANLGGTNLRGADLRGADLERTDLERANFGGADLRGAYLGHLKPAPSGWHTLASGYLEKDQ